MRTVQNSGYRTSAAFFAAHPVFTRDEYAQSRGNRSPRTVDSLLRQHVANGSIVRVRRGLYAARRHGADASTAPSADPYLLATKAAEDAVVSHHAALQFHGRTYSVWSQVTFFTARHARSFTFGGNEFVPIKPPRSIATLPEMGGHFELVAHAGGAARVSTCERAMVDVLHAPALGGGWEEIWRSLEMVEFFDLDAVISYTLALDNALTTARIGYFLEQHRAELFVEEHHLATLERQRPRQVRYLDPSRESGQLEKRWQLIVPARVRHRSWEEVA